MAVGAVRCARQAKRATDEQCFPGAGSRSVSNGFEAGPFICSPCKRYDETRRAHTQHHAEITPIGALHAPAFGAGNRMQMTKFD